MIQIEVIGRIGNGGEVRQVGAKQAFCFSVAHSDRRDGQEVTTWVSVVYYGINSKVVQYLQKGATVRVTGRPDWKIYTDRSGQNNVGLTVYANDLTILVFPPKEQQTQQQVQPQQTAQQFYTGLSGQQTTPATAPIQQMQEPEPNLPF